MPLAPGRRLKYPEGDIVIRPATAADVPRMCGLLSELFSIEADFTSDAERQAAGLKLLIDDSPSLLIVAEDKGKLVGMCSVQKLISTAQGGPVALLEDLIISEQHRGSGIGTKLMSEVFNWCRKENLSRVQLLADNENTRALKFYRGKGYNRTKLICLRKVF
jgi:ribosomal protein S18 acetylase RimI-like enzyme